MDQLSATAAKELVMDPSPLGDISGAGLRVLPRIRKSYPDMRIINVHSEVCEILDDVTYPYKDSQNILTMKKLKE